MVEDLEVSLLVKNPKFFHGVDDELEHGTNCRAVKLAENAEKMSKRSAKIKKSRRKAMRKAKTNIELVMRQLMHKNLLFFLLRFDVRWLIN
jgi:hypothetical protein